MSKAYCGRVGTPVELEVVLWIVYLCLWATFGFIAELAAKSAGVSSGICDVLFRAIGVATVAYAGFRGVQGYRKGDKVAREAIVRICCIYMWCLLLPVYYTFDSGHYHIPLIEHLRSKGLEWNLGWLNSRYSYFSALFYGQAAIERLNASEIWMPSLNKLASACCLSILAKSEGEDERGVGWQIGKVITGAFILVSLEAAQGWHSFNPDWFLGCICLIAAVVAISGKREEKSKVIELAVAGTAIKLSGVFAMVPVLVAGLYRCRRVEWARIGSIAIMVALATSLSSVAQTGYLSYPISLTRIDRAGAIPKETAIREAKLGTLAFARFNYSGQAEKMRIDAKPSEWMPRWVLSKNGKTMLSAVGLGVGALAVRKKEEWSKELYIVIAGNVVVLLMGIWVLPPDPRFYYGSILCIVYGCTGLLLDELGFRYEKGKHMGSTAKKWGVGVAVLLIVVLVRIWRGTGDGATLSRKPTIRVDELSMHSIGAYTVNDGKVRVALDGSCWNAKSPCIPGDVR